MKVQFDVDVATLDEALVLSRLVAEYVDIIELGTRLIKNEGLAAISAIKASYPDKVVLADMKTADSGEYEARIAFRAGADLVTVLGGADDDTIRGAVAAARSRGKGVVADMITVGNHVTRAREVATLGVEYCEIHARRDDQVRCGYSIHAAIAAGRRSEVPFSIAGGVDIDSIREVQASGALVAVVGTAIQGAPDPRDAAARLRVAVDTCAVLGGIPWARQGRPHGIPCGPGPGRARRAQLAGHASSA